MNSHDLKLFAASRANLFTYAKNPSNVPQMGVGTRFAKIPHVLARARPLLARLLGQFRN